MSLLDTFPDRCTIRRRVAATKGALGAKKPSYTVEQTNVPCWEQQTGATEEKKYAKLGLSVSSKVYFVTQPNLTSRHEILITSRGGSALASPVSLSVTGEPVPDVSVGKGLLWKVMCAYNRSEGD